MSDNSDDTNFFWQQKYGRDQHSGMEQYIDGSDALANSNFTLAFQHVGSGQTVFFKAFITKYSEDFTSDWASTMAFGRTDPIYTFANTRRVISLGFSVPAGSESEAFENMGRVGRLTQFLYPTYYNTGDAQSPQLAMGQSPLVRMKMMNLVTKGQSSYGGPMTPALEAELIKQKRSTFMEEQMAPGSHDASEGLLGVITNCSITQDFDKEGVLEVGRGQIFPNNYSISITFNPIHEQTLGWNEEKQPLVPTFPHGAMLKPVGGDLKVDVDSDQSYSARQTQERNMQAAEDIAKAAFSGLFKDGIFAKEGGMPGLAGRAEMAKGRAAGKSYFMGIETSNWDLWDRDDNKSGAEEIENMAEPGSLGYYLGQEADDY